MSVGDDRAKRGAPRRPAAPSFWRSATTASVPVTVERGPVPQPDSATSADRAQGPDQRVVGALARRLMTMHAAGIRSDTAAPLDAAPSDGTNAIAD